MDVRELKNRLGYELTKFMEVKVILNRLETEGFLDKLITLFKEIRDSESSVLINELNKMNVPEPDRTKEYNSSLQIFKDNMKLIMDILYSDIWKYRNSIQSSDRVEVGEHKVNAIKEIGERSGEMVESKEKEGVKGKRKVQRKTINIPTPQRSYTPSNEGRINIISTNIEDRPRSNQEGEHLIHEIALTDRGQGGEYGELGKFPDVDKRRSKEYERHTLPSTPLRISDSYPANSTPHKPLIPNPNNIQKPKAQRPNQRNTKGAQIHHQNPQKKPETIIRANQEPKHHRILSNPDYTDLGGKLLEDEGRVKIPAPCDRNRFSPLHSHHHIVREEMKDVKVDMNTLEDRYFTLHSVLKEGLEKDTLELAHSKTYTLNTEKGHVQSEFDHIVGAASFTKMRKGLDIVRNFSPGPAAYSPDKDSRRYEGVSIPKDKRKMTFQSYSRGHSPGPSDYNPKYHYIAKH